MMPVNSLDCDRRHDLLLRLADGEVLALAEEPKCF